MSDSAEEQTSSAEAPVPVLYLVQGSYFVLDFVWSQRLTSSPDLWFKVTQRTMYWCKPRCPHYGVHQQHAWKAAFLQEESNGHESKLLCELKQPRVSGVKQGIHFKWAALLRAHTDADTA